MRNTAKRLATIVTALLMASEVFAPLVANAQVYSPRRSPMLRADLATSISTDVSQITPGTQNIQVDFSTVNYGPVATSKSIMTVKLPRGITIQTPPATSACKTINSFSGQTVECTSGPLEPNATSSYSMTVEAAATMKCPQSSLRMSARIASSSHRDSNVRNNASSKSLSVICAAQPTLSISLDGPVTQAYKPGKKDVVFADVAMEASADINVSREVLVVQGVTTLTNLPNGRVAMIDRFVQNVELRNKATGQIVRASLFRRVSSPEGQFGLYRINNFILRQGVNHWEIRGDLTLSTQNGDKFRVGTCTTAAGSSDPLCNFSSSIPPSTSHSLVATTLNGQRVTSVRPGGVMTGNYQLVGVPTLTVSQRPTVPSDTATANQKNINLLKFEARANDMEDILLTELRFKASEGDLLNLQNYVLWVDTDGDGSTDTILEKGVAAGSGLVVFDELIGGGYVIPKSGTSAVFEVHGDVSSSPRSQAFQLSFATDHPTTYVEPETVSDGTPLLGISTDGVCTRENGSPACQTVVLTAQATHWSFVTGGNLFVTKSSSPIRSRQLLGGTLGDEILRLRFRADKEDIDVTDIVLTATDENRAEIAQNVDRLELYKTGATTPFATATVGGCGTNDVPAFSFCASLTNQQLIVAKQADVNILVRPRMRTDTDGAVSGQFVKIMVDGSSGTTIRARGLNSSNNLLPNDGDAVAEGEVFIGTDTAGQNREIVGSKNVVVLSKVVSVTNANPDPNGTSVPMGVSEVGQFKFATAAANNGKSGPNKWTLADVIFTVNATNVAFGTGSFAFYNKADETAKASCTVLDSTATQPRFFVACWDIAASSVDSSIDPGTDSTFVLEADILNPSVNPTLTSSLIVSIEKFSDASVTGVSSSLSHLRWLDKDNAGDNDFFWIEYPETVIRSTQYSGAPVMQADLALSSPEMFPSSVRTGTQVTFTQVVRNLGPGSPQRVTLRTNIPATHHGDAFVFAAAPWSSPTCAIDPNDAGTILCKDVLLGSAVAVSFTVPSAVKCPAVASFHAIAESELADTNMGNNVGDINSIDVSCDNLLLGDVTGNGQISSLDVSWLSQYLLPVSSPYHRVLTPDQMKRADVNQDGRVSKADKYILPLHVVGCIKTLPWAFGDANLDGKIDALDLAIVQSYMGRTDVETTGDGCDNSGTRSIRMSDADEDGTITIADYYLMEAASQGKITLPAMFGDVTGNMMVQSNDTTMIRRYIAGTQTFTPAQIFLADVNMDGSVNETDVDLVRRHIGEVVTLPQLCGNGIINDASPAGEQCDDGNTTNGDGCSAQCSVENHLPASVIGRHVFYNDSSFDGNDETIGNNSDSSAIANDKNPLFNGQKATFANYTSYDKGINGLIIDIANLATPNKLGMNDFEFRTGNGNDVQKWTAANAPAVISNWPGKGASGSTRIHIGWIEERAVRGKWLEITVKANDVTGLAENDVFYFGNAVGDSGLGNTPDYALVDAIDRSSVRSNFADNVPVSSLYDFDRDSDVDDADVVIAKNNSTTFLTALRLITPGASSQICGNGKIESPEQCDDGNTTNGDGCSAQCTKEHALLPDLMIEDISMERRTFNHNYDKYLFSFHLRNIGDSKANAPIDMSITCDRNDEYPSTGFRATDRHDADLNAQSSVRTVGHVAYIIPAGKALQGHCDFSVKINGEEKSVENNTFVLDLNEQPPSMCGNGKIESPEQCDDGNTTNGDGCNDRCETPNGYAFRVIDTSGNGKISPLELTTAFQGIHQTFGQSGDNLTYDFNQDGKIMNIDKAIFQSVLPHELMPNWNVLVVIDTGVKPGQPGARNADGILTDEEILNTYRILLATQGQTGDDLTADFDNSLSVGNLDISFFLSTLPEGSGRLFNLCGNGVTETGEQCDDGNTTNGDGCSATCAAESVKTGNLSIITDNTPVRSHQYLGGVLGEEALRLKFETSNESIEVTDMMFTSVNGPAESVDRLELFRDGATQPFAFATIAGCGTDPVPTAPAGKQYRTFCAKMMNQEFVIDDNDWYNPPRVSIRPRIKTDTNGAISAEPLTLALLGGIPGVQVVKAQGVLSHNQLIVNNGTLTDDGEIMIGPFRTNDIPLTGSDNVVVLSKITSITNADPNPNGSAIPVGTAREIGQFKFTAAANNNGKNGLNMVAVDGIIFNVSAQNVGLATGRFFLSNKSDPTRKASCQALAPDGTPMTGSMTTLSSFMVSCPNLLTGAGINAEVQSGASETFVLQADVLNGQVNSGSSALQVSMQDFADSSEISFGPQSSHIQWVDEDFVLPMSPPFFWIEHPETMINGTTYAG